MFSNSFTHYRLAKSLGAGVLATCLSFSAQAATTAEQTNQLIRNWPDVSVKAAKEIIQKYGQPNEATPTMLVWNNNGPWKRTIVYKQEVAHDFPMPHKDVLEQFIPYNAPADKFDELAAYDGSVIAERTKGELSARCDKEAANFIALNLANDIVQDSKSVEEARQAYVEAIKATMDGNPPAIAQKLTFNVQQNYAGDTDRPVMQMSQK
jgi:hypothetical protein